MSKPILIKKIEQAGSIYIGVDLPYDPSQIEKIKQVEGRMWSIPLRCWLIPYTKESYARLKSLFNNLQVQVTATIQEQGAVNHAFNPSLPHTPEPALSKVKMAMTPKRILLQLPKNETDLAFIRSLQYARWDKNTFSWCITPTAQNEGLLKRFFGERLELITLPSPGLETEQASGQVSPPPAIEKNKLLIIHFRRCLEIEERFFRILEKDYQPVT
ncbi:hypothetical protein GXP67_05615 [Rhodocytophaga rosea]|uniref:Uncharacterized protein n=1 Tax=Rhodocytophaga rosea TaxID=2704465 RepID=A0A6C0GEI3_9BACT|nr:hypothetical protein [Rhodocytophaga rosea]QHT66183.1 hypothetical protein GXP67_05615 [Rhodocytophaga rosea]